MCISLTITVNSNSILCIYSIMFLLQYVFDIAFSKLNENGLGIKLCKYIGIYWIFYAIIKAFYFLIIFDFSCDDHFKRRKNTPLVWFKFEDSEDLILSSEVLIDSEYSFLSRNGFRINRNVRTLNEISRNFKTESDELHPFDSVWIIFYFMLGNGPEKFCKCN